MRLDKFGLFERGKALLLCWCGRNGVTVPRVVESREPTDYNTYCAFYRDGVITIWVPACAAVGTAGRAWSWPGHSVDRTPFGVILHELGHHADMAHGAHRGTYGRTWRAETKAKPMSDYCDNDNEWFAEMFRVFVGNPDLLRRIRPSVYERMIARWPALVEARPYEAVLAGAERQLAVLRKRIVVNAMTGKGDT